jgi:hypothetical protein
MAKKQLFFYATTNDLLDVLETAASKTSFSFAHINEKSKPPEVYQNFTDIDDLSIANFGDQNKEKFYLLINPEAKPKIRIVEQRNGGVKMFFDQRSHPESVLLRPGGVFKEFECIVAGQIGTISQDQWSESLYKLLAATLRKQFTKIKSFYVGAEALVKLDQRVRLTTNMKCPIEYDLQR